MKIRIKQIQVIAIIASIFSCLTILPLQAKIDDTENLNYDIVYHWGVIWKSAASANLTLNRNDNHYTGRLTARTLPWADKIYQVRDTLTTHMMPERFKPLEYIKASHEGKWVGTDVIDFTYPNADEVIGHSTLYRKDGKHELVIEGEGLTYDMLSVFFYLRTLDFENMKSGETITTNIFSGKRKETLTIKYLGTETITLRNKSTHNNAIKLELTFSSGKKKNSSTPISAWLSADDQHVPLMLRGSISVGEVRVFLSQSL